MPHVLYAGKGDNNITYSSKNSKLAGQTVGFSSFYGGYSSCPWKNCSLCGSEYY